MSKEIVVQKGHPKGLMVLFFSEMWERFCYYGMRVLLTLYLVKSLMKGDGEAALIYGAYTGLVYAAPILGGRMADKFLGYRLAVMLGAILMAIGEFLILGGNTEMLLVGMGALIIGNGYFKANISTIVGKLYDDGDPRRDSGFTIFYIGINIGALLATTVVAYVGETYGFRYGFGLAGFGMLLGLLIFWLGRERYAAAPGLDIREEGKKKIFGPLTAVQVVVIVSILLIPLCYLLILNNSVLDYIFLGLFVYVAISLYLAGQKEDKATGQAIWKDRMIALIIFIVINVVFWACFEQAGTSLTLFADRNVDRSIMGWIMPASMTQFFNPFFIIVFGSIFSRMWIKLSEMGRNPSIPMKFSLGIFQLGLGFLVTFIGFQFAENNLVPLLTLLFLYLLHTTGELFLSPIGLSMVTKLSPKTMAGTAMGAWFLSFAIANFLGGKIAALTGANHGGGDEKEKTEFNEGTTVLDAFEKMNKLDAFENWSSLAPELEGLPPQLLKEYSVPANISYGKWLDIQDWVLFREGIAQNKTFSEWLNTRENSEKFTSAEAWLDKDKWNDLGKRYTSIVMADKNAGDNAGVGLKDWLYFRGGISEFEDQSLSLQETYEQHREIVQKNSLDKYVSVFRTLGLVLIGFSLLVALINAPLKKLMHGIE